MTIALAENPRAVIGGNMPPPTPYELAEKAVEDAYLEAVLWLDGAEIADQDTADGLGNLLTIIRTAKKTADDARKTEAEPFDKGKAEVQARYKPLLEKADRAADACKRAIGDWLAKVRAKQEEAARKARDEADRKRREAEEAIRQTEAANLAEREAAEKLVAEAKRAEKIATKAENAKAQAGGTVGKAIGLKTVNVVYITDPVLAARHYWVGARQEMQDLLQSLAERDVRLGKRDIPGIQVREEKRAV